MKFLDYAINNKKVKSLSDIMENGIQLEGFIIRESSTLYNGYLIGDLVFVQKYKYKNGMMGNNHIFLIVDIDSSKRNTIYYGMILSSKIEKISYSANKFIKRDLRNKLNKDSIIKTDVIYEIFTQNILLKIGKIDKTKVEIYKNSLINNM